MTRTDPAVWLKNLLDANWNASNVNQGIRPIIEVVYEVRRQQIRQSTVSPAVIFIYLGDTTEKYVDFRRDFKYVYHNTTIDIRYGPVAEGQSMQAAHNNAYSIWEEARRIIESARKLPNINTNIPSNQIGANSSFTHIYLTNFNDLSNKSIRLFRFTSNVEIKIVVEAVPNFSGAKII